MNKFTFQLRGHTWTVTRAKGSSVDNVYREHHKSEGGAHGLTVFEDAQIYVADDLSPGKTVAVLWHEITHAILEICNETLDEEVVCNLVGDGMLEIVPQMKSWPTWAKGK